MNKAKTWAAMACVAVALSACGGGGGGGDNNDDRVDPKNAADGLGNYGELPGTVKLGHAALPGGSAGAGGIYLGVTAALDDTGRALVAWRMDSTTRSDSRAAWSQSTSGGTWSTAQTLLQTGNISVYGMTLRMNAQGDAVLGWVDSGNDTTLSHGRRALRFTAGGSWGSVVNDLSGGTQYSTFGHPADWDLALLNDGSLITEAAPSGGAASIISTDTGGSQSTLLTSTAGADRTAFAFRQDGNGYRYTLGASSSTPGSLDLVFQRVSLQYGPLGPLPIATYSGLCNYPTWYPATPITAKTASPSRSVVAVLTRDASDCSTHNLQLLAVSDPSSIRAEPLRANAYGTWLPTPPALAMDSAGNTLAIWKEATGSQAWYGSQPGNTYRLMWAQALAGQPWSAPQTLIPNLATLGTIPNEGRIAISMNASGQAVAALVLNDLAGSSINASIALSRFDFTNGWAGWRLVANKLMVSDPSVAINASGQGVVAYGAYDGRRVDGKAPNGYSTAPGSPPPAFAYAWRF